MENRYWRWLSWVVIAILFIFIGYGYGFVKGFASGVKFAIKIGLYFTDINIDENKMIQLVQKYQQYCGTDGVAECLDEHRLTPGGIL